MTLKETFKIILILTHPIMPFITEKIWSFLYNDSILNTSWPKDNNNYIDYTLEKNIDEIKYIITTIRSQKQLHYIIPCPTLLTEFDYIEKLTLTKIHCFNNNCIINKI